MIAKTRGKIMAFYNHFKIPLIVVGLILVIIFPMIIGSNYLISVGVKILIYIILASSLNVINGYSGQFNIGQAGFYAIGSYAAGILATRYNFNFWILLIIAGVVTAIAGFLVSLPTRKLSGIYLALVTIGFSEITRLIILNWNSFTGGPMGVKGIPRASFLGIEIKSATNFYYVGLFLVVVTLFIIYRIIHSGVGRAWISIREDVVAAKFLGINTNAMKSINFAVGAFFAGVAGCYSTYYYQYIAPDMFITDEGFNILAMVIIGGQGTIVGPIIGATLVNLITESFRFVSEYRLIVYGLVIILMMWFRPQGIAGDANSIFAVKTSKNKKRRKK